MNSELELKYSEAIRNMLTTETTVVANRMNWMILLQGLLFAAAGQLRDHPAVIGVLAFLGTGVSIAMSREFHFSELAIEEILKRWDAFKATRTPEQLAVMPPAWAGGQVEVNKFDRILSSRHSLPILFSIAWIAMATVLIA